MERGARKCEKETRQILRPTKERMWSLTKSLGFLFPFPFIQMYPIPAPIPTHMDVSHSKTSFSQGLGETLFLSREGLNLNHQVRTHWKGLNNSQQLG